MQKIIRILVVILVLSLLPVSALALTQSETGTVTHETIPFRVNPLYEGLISEADLVTAEVSDPETGLSHTQPTFNATKATYVSPDEAVVQLREQLKARAETVDLYVSSDTADYESLIELIMAYALVHTGDPTEGDYLLWQFAGWGGNVYMEPTDGRTFKYHYVMQVAYYTTAQQEKELDAAVNSLLSSLNLSGKSDYQKVCAVYDYICSNITYDYENLNNPNYLLPYTAYGALMNKTAVCQGYSNLLYRLLLELGIDNRIITGETDEGAHAWNIVKLGDVYYNADATWDSILGGHDYFLKNSEGFYDHYRYIDYSTLEFHTEYPMSETDYVDGVEGVPEHVYVWGMCAEEAYWTIDRDGVLTIYGKGAMEDHPSNEPVLWDYWADGINTIVIEEGITVIGQYAFGGLKNVTKLSLPDSLTFVGYYSFAGCKGLTEVHIPDGVTTISSNAFYNCSNLETVTLGNSVEFIYSEAFYNCTALKEITIPKSVIDINENAFGNCVLLKEVTIPETVRIVDGFQGCTGLETADIHSYRINGFNGCTSLKAVTLHDTVVLMGENAFSGCTSLEQITIPASVEEVRVECFSDCVNLKEVTFLGDAPKFDKNVFQNTTTTVYYPANNPTWTKEVMQQYGGTITWLPDTEKVPEVPTGLLGDVSGDGIVDSYDAALVAMYDVYLIDETGLDLSVADVSGDGIVDSYDAALIAMYDVYLIPEFPAAS